MGVVRGFSKDVEKTRTIEFVFSDETRDTYGTVFKADGWDLDRFNKNGIAFFNHVFYSSDPNMAIGSGRAWVEGKRLLGSITFENKELNPLAETVFRKYLAGTYKGCSIRFFPLESGKYGVGQEAADGENPTYYIGKRELVEISCVPIPSNKNALVRSIGAESLPELKEDEGYYTEGLVRLIEVDENRTGENDVPKDKGDSNDEAYSRAIDNAVRALNNY